MLRAKDSHAPKRGRTYEDNHSVEISTLIILEKISGTELLKPDAETRMS